MYSSSGNEVLKPTFMLVVFNNFLAVAVRELHFVVSYTLSCCEIKILSSTNRLFPSLLILR